MALRKRQKKQEDQLNEMQNLVSEEAIEQKDDIESMQKQYEKKLRGFEKQAYEVIDMLKREKGIDIYAPGRYGGMYLKNAKRRIVTEQEFIAKIKEEDKPKEKTDKEADASDFMSLFK